MTKNDSDPQRTRIPDVPFVPAPGVTIRDAIARVYEKASTSGLPATYLTWRHTRVVGAHSGTLRESLLVDLGTSNSHGEVEETRTVRPSRGEVMVQSTRRSFFRRSMATSDAVVAELESANLGHLLEHSHWYLGDNLLTGNWNYWIDPENEWPIWFSFLGCGKELGDGSQSSANHESWGVSQQLAYATNLSGGTLNLMPFVSVRLTQDLIRVGRGRVQERSSGEEEVYISFELGTLGWALVTANAPELHYDLLLETSGDLPDQVDQVQSGTIRLTEKDLKSGLCLAGPRRARIRGSRLELTLNGILVDRVAGAYLRSIALTM